MKRLLGIQSLGAVTAVLSALALTQACSEADLAGGCEADISAKVEALNVAAEALVEVSGELKAEIGAACFEIATAGGEDPDEADDWAEASDDEIEAVCASASAAIEAQISAQAEISIVVTPGRCEANFDAQFDCEAKCDIEGECDPGSIEVRCEPGELSVTCEGECVAGARCEGSAEVAANCEGTCEGSCTGTCSGTCSGSCSGNCSGTCDGDTADGVACEGECIGECDAECTGGCDATCSGTCSGSCTLDADVQVECGAEAKCTGGCDGEATAPSCTGEIDPPECDIEAECQAGCDGQASLEAECTPPSVEIVGGASIDADFIAALEANLPAIINGASVKGQLALSAAADVSEAAVDVAAEAAGIPGCVVAFGADFFASMQASAEAAASVSVSVEASASVSGSAGTS